MICSRHHSYSHRAKVFRSSSNKVFTGVCGGLSEHFGVSSKLMRLGFVIGFLIQPPVVLILYVVATFILPMEEGARGDSEPRPIQGKRKKQRVSSHTKQEILEQMSRQFDLIETKVRKMEDYVTSRDYVLKRKFDEL